jgi:hypothetical protein
VIRSTTDHDKKVKFGDHIILCYSPEQLKQLYPDGGYTVLGETADKSKAEQIATLVADKKQLSVAELNSHSRLLYSVVGYVKVGDDQYVALLHNRLLFLLLLLGGLALLIALIFLLLSLMQPRDPVIIDPDHPLPTQDGNAEQLPSDPNSQRPDVPDGGGSLSMIYTLEAELSLSTGVIRIYFQNPAASSHDVSVILYITAGDQEIAIAQSGLLKAGYGLSVLEFVEGTAQLQEGIYTGKYLLSCFDPETGERALVQPEIAGVTITVVP